MYGSLLLCLMIVVYPVVDVDSLSVHLNQDTGSSGCASRTSRHSIKRRNAMSTVTSIIGSSFVVASPNYVSATTRTTTTTNAPVAVNTITTAADNNNNNNNYNNYNSKDSVYLPNVSLKFPLLSFGLQIYDDATAYKLTTTALEVGYRNFFASVLAGNQRGFAKAIRDSNIPREDLFICGSVVSNRVQGFTNAKRSTTMGWEKNLEAFQTGNIDYLDQIMLDYPGPDNESIRGQWSSFIEMMEHKYVKSLSVSNFSTKQLLSIVNVNDPTVRQYNPVVNQLPYSVAYHPGDVISDNAKLGVLVQAWAPLGGSLDGRFNQQMKDTCAQIGSSYNKSGSQVALKWILQNGAAVCTQTKKRDHFVEDLSIFDFELSSSDMAILDNLAPK